MAAKRVHCVYADRWVAIENQTHSFPIFQTASRSKLNIWKRKTTS